MQNLAKLGLGSLFIAGLALVALSGCSKSESPPPPPTPPETASGNLVEATASGDLDCSLAGTGDSGNMALHVNNKSEREWDIEVEIGTELEPSEEDVQKMVVTTKVEIKIEPHEEQDTNLDVACLEISKEAPSDENKGWSVRSVPALSQFIATADGVIDQEYDKLPDNDQKPSKTDFRSGILQAALWKARGATRQDWVNFEVRYNKLSEEDAEKTADGLDADPVLQEILQNAPSISDN